jgi:hypothetical protein
MSAPAGTRAHAALAVDDVQVTGFNQERIANAVLESPKPGSETGAYAITIAGWAIGLPSPLAYAQVNHVNLVLAELPASISRPDVAESHPDRPWAASSGFGAQISALRLHPQFELIINLVLENGLRSGFVKVTGRRGPLRSAYEPRFQPLMVTTLGRTGSTWLMHLLGSHPALMTYRPFKLEPRAATYWLDLMVSLSEPSASFTQLDSQVDFGRPWWLGPGPAEGPYLPDPRVKHWLVREHVEGLAAMAQERIDAVYHQIAAFHPERSPRYFVEKFLPDNTIPQLAWELYPDAREIFLVRDFRDMVCSMRSYDAKRGVPGFGRDGAESEDLYIRQTLGATVEMLRDSWHRRSEQAHLVRYEDLILEPERTLTGVFEYVGVDASPSFVRGLLEGASKWTPEMSEHQTTAGPEQSIGRWRRDLEPEWLEACEEAFGPALEEFGYATSD